MACCSNTPECDAFDLLYSPELYIKDHYLGSFYQKHPVLSRCVMMPVVLVSAPLKVLLLPVTTAVAIAAYPIIALGQGTLGHKKAACGSLNAWAFSVIAFGLTMTFVALGIYKLPLYWTGTFVMTGIGISVVIHVYRACKAPSDGTDSFIPEYRGYIKGESTQSDSESEEESSS